MCWSALQKPKFTPDKSFEARASSGLALAFHFIFDKLSALSRSKMAVVLAKSTKKKFLPEGSELKKNKK